MNNNRALVFRTATVVFMATLTLMSADSVAAELSNITINGSPAAAGTQLQATNPPTIAVSYAGSDAVWVKFRQNDATWRVQMTPSGSVHSVVMPALPKGTVYYKVERGSGFDPIADIAVSEALPEASSEYHSYVNIDTLGILRKPDLAVWRAKVGTTSPFTGILDAKWYGIAMSMNFDYTVNLPGLTALGLPHNDPAVRTRELANVGTIWFKAKYNGVGAGTLIVEKSSLLAQTSPHENIATLLVPASTDWYLFRLNIDSESLAYYRIRHPSGIDNNIIMVKDIAVSPLAPDVVMTKNPVEYTPSHSLQNGQN